MKIQRLDFLAYGPFTEDVLDFTNRSGLQIIYGPNEAGKTSALRAIGDVLFGIPVQTDDDFIHPYSRLRLGITIEMGNGETVSVIRRKAQKKTLFFADDITPFDEQNWQHYFKFLNRETFETTFGINHTRLRAGGAELVKGGGELGQLLFSAGTGLPHLRLVQQKLNEKCDLLFKSRGKSQILLKVEDYKESQRQLKAARIGFDVWKEKQRQLQHVQTRLQEVQQSLQELTGQHSRLDRIHKASRSVANWQQARAGWLEQQSIPDLPENFADQFQEASNQLQLADANLQQWQAEQKIAREQLSELPVNRPILAEQAAVEQLQNDLGSYEKARKDRQKLSSDVDYLHQGQRQILLELGLDTDLSQLSRLRLPTEISLSIQELIPQQQILRERLEVTSRELAEVSADLDRDRLLLEQLTHVPDYAPLQSLLKTVQSAGDLEKFAEETELAIAKTEAKISHRMQRLPAWKGTFDELAAASIPLPSSISEFANARNNLSRKLELLESQQQEAEQNRQIIHKQLLQLEQDGPVLSVDDLTAARTVRDQFWTDLKQQAVTTDQSGTFIATLVTQFEEAVRHVDEIADRLRTDADRVARKQQLTASSDQALARLDAIKTQQQQLNDRSAELETRWKQLWQNLPVDLLSPEEMLEWQQHYSELMKWHDLLHEQQQQKKAWADKHQDFCNRLRSAIEQIEPVIVDTDDYRLLCEQAENIVESLRSKAQKRTQLQEFQQQRASKQQAVAARKTASEANWKTWQTDWQKSLTKAGLDNSLSPAIVKQLLEKLDHVFTREKECQDKQQRIAGIDQDASTFYASLAELRERLGLNASDQPPAVQVRQVVDLWQHNNRDHEQSQLLTRQLKKLQVQIQEAEQSKRLAEQSLKQLCEQADCGRSAELPLVISRFREKQRFRELLEQSEQAILPLTNGQPFNDFIAEVQAESQRFDEYPALMSQLEQQIKLADENRDRLLGEQTEIRRELENMAGHSQAREYAAHSQSLAAAIETDIDEYARFKIAQLLLTNAIEHYREKSQGPVLEKASQLFRQMTGGYYSGLKADYNDLGQPALKGLRGENSAGVQAEEMSDGTCDQLYLALRLASLEHAAGEQPTFPLILDDILLNFDDVRATATLKMLCEFSQRTQVLFFTHHQHLLELIGPEIQAGKIHVHQLRSRLLQENRPQQS